MMLWDQQNVNQLRNRSDKQCDSKKNGLTLKPATANPAFKDGLKPVCQICGVEREALQCTRLNSILK